MLIAHISDCHLRAGGTCSVIVPVTEVFERTVAYLNALESRPDAVVITGDLTDAGEPEAFADAARILKQLEIPCWIVPGNHDQRDRMREAFPDHAYMFDKQHQGRIQFMEDRFPLRLIGLDTLQPGLSAGKAYEESLEWLETMLADGKPSVVFMHHPPFPVGVACMDKGVFVNADKLADVLERNPNALRLCCGHMHRAVLREFGKTLTCTAPSSSMPLRLNLATTEPPQFTTEPPGLALHLYDETAEHPAIVTHFAQIPGGDHTWTGPHPFTDVVLPL